MHCKYINKRTIMVLNHSPELTEFSLNIEVLHKQVALSFLYKFYTQE